ncbi:PREDICTED: uncharacterized protein LOC108565104 [Nicrophorus vespilloides]|uniref:Uncharacterized protein LOC108565104 n=1 Tax=Nicrophorus vespilloides TaxID=110193 RepID=A0ABM1MZ86_NICVS|nr:PREDICTED: uncharacterized protein LOC108565104 [Nicrophorus vespilloides]
MDNSIFKIKYSYLNTSKLSCCHSAPHRHCSILESSTKIHYENIKVRCLSHHQVIYMDYFHFIANSGKRAVKRISPNPKPLNVLVLILAGISNNQMNSSLPKTHKFIKQNFMVYKFNYVQPQRSFGNVAKALRSDLDIWEVYKKKGFVTAFAQDRNSWPLDGFDFNLRDFYNFAQEGILINDHCLGHRRTYDLVLEYASDFLKLRKSQPAFGVFHLETFRKQNLNAADEQFFDFLTDLYFHLKRDTVLFFFGDTNNENPFYYLLVPEDYLEEFPDVRYFLEVNSEARMVTFEDIYWTLRNFADPYQKEHLHTKNAKSQSLFQGVPSNRLCSEAGVEPDSCFCKKQSLFSLIFQKSA